jgi:phosphoglycolate phosphatase
MYKLAIFDLDGTLLNTLHDLAASANYALRQKSYPEHTVEAYKEFIGHGPVHLITAALPPEHRDDESVRELRGLFAAHYALHGEDLTKPYPGVTGVLNALKQSGTKIAVYSNKPHKNTAQLCGFFFPGLIDMSVGYRDGVPPKPDPATGFEILKHFMVTGKETAYIGDSGVDMMTGRALGAFTIGVSWGFRPRAELTGAGASAIADNAEDLANLLLTN